MFSTLHSFRDHCPQRFKFHDLEHHQTLAELRRFLFLPFDSAAILTWDGTGEDTTTLFCKGKANKIDVLKRIKLPHSLGQFYSAVTNFIGFDMFTGDEWKVMDTQPYGKPKHYDFFAKRYCTKTDGTSDFKYHMKYWIIIWLSRINFVPSVSLKNSVLHGSPLKSSGSTSGTLLVLPVLQNLRKHSYLFCWQILNEMTGEKTNLCMAGGVAFNSVMNGRIFHETPFRIYAGGGDGGCSRGVPYAWHQLLKKTREFVYHADGAYCKNFWNLLEMSARNWYWIVGTTVRDVRG